MKSSSITIHDIARELKVAASTVSRALNDHPKISQQTKAAVHEMAERLNYQHNNIAAALRKGKTEVVGLLVPSVASSFFSSVIRGTEEVLRQHGYNVMVCQSHEQLENEESNLDTLLNARVDGIITSLSLETNTYVHLKKVQEAGIPLILFDRTSDEVESAQVVVDDYKGAYDAVSHLIHQGCENIAHLGGTKDSLIHNKRCQGYKDALKDRKIAINEDLICELPMVGIQQGFEFATQLLSNNIGFDGLFTSVDNVAIGAMQAIKLYGLSIPDDVAVVGFSNEPLSLYMNPPLSTVDQHSRKMGNHMANLFLKMEEGTLTPDEYHTVIEPTLIIRESSLRKK